MLKYIVMNSLILHQNSQWYNFYNILKTEKGNKCKKCNKEKNNLLLDFNHYKSNKSPWEQEKDSAFFICKNCFQNNTNIPEPEMGWYLLEIRDLGGLSGMCEKHACKQKIRYEYQIYHPEYGYLAVGSTCVDYLTGKEKKLCIDIKKEYTHTKQLVNKYKPIYKINKKGLKFLEYKYKNTIIRIYKKDNNNFISRITKIKNKKPLWDETLTSTKFNSGKKALEFSVYKVKQIKSKNEEHKAIFDKLINII